MRDAYIWCGGLRMLSLGEKDAGKERVFCFESLLPEFAVTVNCYTTQFSSPGQSLSWSEKPSMSSSGLQGKGQVSLLVT